MRTSPLSGLPTRRHGPWRALLLLLPLALPAACAPQGMAPVAATRSVPFLCVAEGGTPAPPPRRGRAAPVAAPLRTPTGTENIIIAFDAQNRPVTLDVGVPLRSNYVLEQLPGAGNLFSAGDSYGWRGDPAGGVLTDVPSATQFRCQPRASAVS